MRNLEKERPDNLVDFLFRDLDYFPFGRDFLRFPSMSDMFKDTPLEGYRTPVLTRDDTETTYKINVEIPGVNKEKIDVTLDGRVLTIKAGDKYEEKEDDSQRSGSYSYQQTLTLPRDASDEITSKYDNGVLSIEIPKNTEYQKDIKKIDVE